MRGTQAQTVVPPLSRDSIESVPFRSFSLSSVLIRPSPRFCFASFGVKPGVTVANREPNLVPYFPQPHVEVAYATVLGRIVERFLQNAEKTKRSIRRQRDWPDSQTN